jgi:hypothetical protein
MENSDGKNGRSHNEWFGKIAAVSPQIIQCKLANYCPAASSMETATSASHWSVETKNLKRAVKRNIERFPYDFMFELTQNEVNFLRCQFDTLETSRRGQHTKLHLHTSIGFKQINK